MLKFVLDPPDPSPTPAMTILPAHLCIDNDGDLRLKLGGNTVLWINHHDGGLSLSYIGKELGARLGVEVDPQTSTIKVYR